ncbi:MAG: hypothetical protein P4L33_05440 [Capsulimonadaceae bacterium]|nr:hypothetical protein [Capsulimonadaceae bacterium]
MNSVTQFKGFLPTLLWFALAAVSLVFSPHALLADSRFGLPLPLAASFVLPSTNPVGLQSAPLALPPSRADIGASAYMIPISPPVASTAMSLPLDELGRTSISCGSIGQGVLAGGWTSCGYQRSFGHGVVLYTDVDYWADRLLGTGHRILRFQVRKDIRRGTQMSFEIGGGAFGDTSHHMFKLALRGSF